MPLNEFPGYLGFTSQGVIAIHADWPVYPAEHGPGTALASLGNFPEGTVFQPISDIDRCFLFFVPGYGNFEDLFDERALHVAAWDKDLLVLQQHHLVEGVLPLTERMWEEQRRQELRDEIRQQAEEQGVTLDGDPLLSLGWLSEDGQWHPANLPPLDEYGDDDDEFGLSVDDDELEFFPFAAVDKTRGLRITEQGWTKLESILADELTIPASVQPRIQALLDAELYDTAVRELGVTIESRLRQALDSKLNGQRLVDAFIGRLGDPNQYLQVQVKVLRGELRTAFKFVRNEFAHNLVDLPKARALALVSRLSMLLADIEAIDLDADSA